MFRINYISVIASLKKTDAILTNWNTFINWNIHFIFVNRFVENVFSLLFIQSQSLIQRLGPIHDLIEGTLPSKRDEDGEEEGRIKGG